MGEFKKKYFCGLIFRLISLDIYYIVVEIPLDSLFIICIYETTFLKIVRIEIFSDNHLKEQDNMNKVLFILS